MFAAWLGLVLCVAAADAPKASPGEPSLYQKATLRAGADPDANVRIALWCEHMGWTAERAKHLTIALLSRPADVKARGLLGLDETGGRAASSGQPRDDARTQAEADYELQRLLGMETADDHWRLGAWCENHGLKDQALAHFTAVTRLDPERAAAWKKLGYHRNRNRWMTDEQIAAERVDIEARIAAEKAWRPKLIALKEAFHGDDAKRRDAAGQELLRITDPEAVLVILKVFGRGKAFDQDVVVRLLSNIDSRPSTVGLAGLAVGAHRESTRRSATEALLHRDRADFLPLLIDQLHEPTKVRVLPVDGLDSAGVVQIERENSITRRVYQAPSSEALQPRPGEVLDRDAAGKSVYRQTTAGPARDGVTGLPTDPEEDPEFVITRPLDDLMRQAFNALSGVERKMYYDARRYELEGFQTGQVNLKIVRALTRVTGLSFGLNLDAWRTWWTDESGSPTRRSAAPSEKPVTVEYQQVAEPPPIAQYAYMHHRCFVAGTLVHTAKGPQPIEDIKIGDMVLSQNTESGGLSYRPVVAVSRSDAQETLRVNIGEDTFITTPIHRFWRPGVGWTMARDLKPGESVRALGRVIRVLSVYLAGENAVYNLEVDKNHSYFVGPSMILANDIAAIKNAAKPFDAVDADALTVR